MEYPMTFNVQSHLMRGIIKRNTEKNPRYPDQSKEKNGRPVALLLNKQYIRGLYFSGKDFFECGV
jgi:hypothetical protein